MFLKTPMGVEPIRLSTVLQTALCSRFEYGVIFLCAQILATGACGTRTHIAFLGIPDFQSGDVPIRQRHHNRREQDLNLYTF